jgi:hypothetical protein
MFIAPADGSPIASPAADASPSVRADAARNAVKPQARGHLPCCGPGGAAFSASVWVTEA